MSGNSDGWCAYARRRWKVWRRAFEVVVLCRAFRELETLVVRQRQNWQLELVAGQLDSGLKTVLLGELQKRGIRLVPHDLVAC